ncbi:MAG: hypothetical protein FVQ83_11995 [Chloroflexi bacterium]|nr:hypothetical protein [Chloroflexota bacterium]
MDETTKVPTLNDAKFYIWIGTFFLMGALAGPFGDTIKAEIQNCVAFPFGIGSLFYGISKMGKIKSIPWPYKITITISSMASPFGILFLLFWIGEAIGERDLRLLFSEWWLLAVGVIFTGLSIILGRIWKDQPQPSYPPIPQKNVPPKPETQQLSTPEATVALKKSRSLPLILLLGCILVCVLAVCSIAVATAFFAAYGA